MLDTRGRGVGTGLSPVLVYELITGTRRAQAYAARSVFLLILLIALVAMWMSAKPVCAVPDSRHGRARPELLHRRG